MHRLFRRATPLVVVVATLIVGGCTSARVHTRQTRPGGSKHAHPPRSTSLPPPPARSTVPTLPPSPISTVPTSPRHSSHHVRSHSPTAPPTTSQRGSVIVIDPGHSVPIHATDPATGLDVSDYENEPEMRDVFAVAELVRAQLLAAGYQVVMTKPTVGTPTSLGERAAIADRAHAALALSIHDQAGANGGLAFDSANNNVYYQSVGNYRETPAGKKIYFTDARVAAESKTCGAKFQRTRSKAQGAPINLLGSTGYDLGTRGLAPGNIWLVQLLSHVPWIYNESGGNSAGMVGLSGADQRRYAAGLVAGVEACVPAGR